MINNKKEILLKKIKTSFEKNIFSKKSDLETEALFEEYLTLDNNVDILVKFMVFLYFPPLADWAKCLEIGEKILILDEENPYALILVTFISESWFNGISNDIKTKLDTLAHDTSNPRLAGMANKILASMMEDKNNFELAIYYLKNALKVAPHNPYSYLDFSLYIKDDKIRENYIKNGLSLIQKITDENFKMNFNTYVDDFFDGHFSGIIMSKPNYDRWLARIGH